MVVERLAAFGGGKRCAVKVWGLNPVVDITTSFFSASLAFVISYIFGIFTLLKQITTVTISVTLFVCDLRGGWSTYGYAPSALISILHSVFFFFFFFFFFFSSSYFCLHPRTPTYILLK
jgi:hypothetical protein